MSVICICKLIILYICALLVANHGGRYLYVDDDNQIQADHNYDLSRPPSDLASKGTVFDTDKQHQLVTNKGPVKYNMGGTPIDLQLEQINADEVCSTCNSLHHHADILYTSIVRHSHEPWQALSVFWSRINPCGGSSRPHGHLYCCQRIIMIRHI